MRTIQHLLIVTGLSGAGKHQVLYQLEDFGYFCIDNLPAPLLAQAVEVLQRHGQPFARLAIGIDVRTRRFLQDLPATLAALMAAKHPLQILFLEADEAELIRRFSESRRPHPLWGKKTLTAEIHREQAQLAWLRERADYVIDTTRLTPPELRRQLARQLRFQPGRVGILLSSFGYKFGVPKDADMVFDMRSLPNPFYVPGLKALSGKHARVRSYLLRQPAAKRLLTRMEQMIRGMLPGFIREGKGTLHVALGCTGGQHRSVVMAEALGRRLKGLASVYHRELKKNQGAAND